MPDEGAPGRLRLVNHAMAPGVRYDHFWHWRARLPHRKGMACRVVARSRRLGSVLVEFEDGYQVVTSRYAVRRANLGSEGEEKAHPTSR